MINPTVLLRDEFDDTRAAGAVNGTLATDGTNTRTVSDGNSKLSIGSGLLSFATGGVGVGNPGLWYPLQTRTAGLVACAAVNESNAGLAAGFDTNQSGGMTDVVSFNGGSLQVVYNGTTLTVGTISLGTDYTVYVVLRAVGAQFFIKGGSYTNPTLIWISSLGSANQYPGFIALGGVSVGAVDYIRVAGYWLPIPLISDGFD